MTDPARPMFASPIGEWHRWFAWRPVRTFDLRWAWLRFVDRRACQSHPWLHGPMLQFFQYRIR